MASNQENYSPCRPPQTASHNLHGARSYRVVYTCTRFEPRQDQGYPDYNYLVSKSERRIVLETIHDFLLPNPDLNIHALPISSAVIGNNLLVEKSRKNR